MKKTLQKIPLLLIIILQASFLLAILHEQLTLIPILLFSLTLGLVLFVAYRQMPIHDSRHMRRDFVAVLFVVVGALLAFYINIILAFGPVIGAAFVGVVASFIPRLKPQSRLLQEAPAAAYCGAFVGMSSQHIAETPFFVLMASLITGLLLVFSKNFFRGVGGKLGTLAFGGVAVTYLLIFLFF
ncbi:hypothetical protein [Pontibacter sp. CAU 1760]